GAAGPQAPGGQAVRADGRRPGGRAGAVRGGRDRPGPAGQRPAAGGAAAAAAGRPGRRRGRARPPPAPAHAALHPAAPPAARPRRPPVLPGGAGGPVVRTGGTASDEPIAYTDDDALARLGGIADAFLTHDRAIHIRTDDSVVRPLRGRETLLRRSRGYAPEPL